MAAYDSTVTVDQISAEKSSRSNGLLSGSVDITNYNSTTTEETDITKMFRANPRVVFGTTDNGFVLQWIKATGKIKAFYADYDAVADGALIEVADDVDVGAADFIAMGVRY